MNTLLPGFAVFTALIVSFATQHPAVAQTTTTTDTAKTIVSAHITAFRNTKGVARVSLFSTDKGFPDKSPAQVQTIDLAKSLTDTGRDITVTFLGVAPGTYAISVLHDENNNGKMDAHWYGKPKEGVAMSNNPRPKMRAPRWNESKFDVPATGKSLDIAVWYP